LFTLSSMGELKWSYLSGLGKIGVILLPPTIGFNERVYIQLFDGTFYAFGP
jgi:hypothetical protein